MEYDNEAINEMCSKIDLLEYAQKSYEFNKRGDEYATNCPRHTDKTPSLFITPHRNLFHCFSCGVGGNIINWIMMTEGMTYYQALEKVSLLTGIELRDIKIPNAVSIFKNLKYKQASKNKPNRDILDESILNQYELAPPKEWIDEGINPEIMEKYNIRIDSKSNRIVYPVYDNNFDLIGIKGRTRYKNYKDLGLKKYQNYHKIGTTDFFIGLRENIDAIKESDEAIVFEGIKSGMKAEGWGYYNWISSETGYLNDEQVKILIDLKVKNVVIAYDNDVEKSKIIECTKTLSKFTNVYYINDKNNILGDKALKMSPVDLDKDTWETLYREKVKINKRR